MILRLIFCIMSMSFPHMFIFVCISGNQVTYFWFTNYFSQNHFYFEYLFSIY